MRVIIFSLLQIHMKSWNNICLRGSKNTSLLIFHLRSIWRVYLGVIVVLMFRLYIFEIYLVDSPSMIPTIQPTEIYCVDKLSGGALMPRRFAEIPIVNVFTWIKPLRELDERNDWGVHRFPGYRNFEKGDVILFHAKDDYKTILVKRIVYTVQENGQTYYYVLGDNADNSTDSRNFGLIPGCSVIGRAKYVLFSWDSEAKGLSKFRWKRLGYNISGNSLTINKVFDGKD